MIAQVVFVYPRMSIVPRAYRETHIIIQIKEYNVIQKKSLGHRVNPRM